MLEITREEARILLDAVTCRLVEQRRHVRSRAEPTPRALEVLDTLQDLKGRLRDIARYRSERHFP